MPLRIQISDVVLKRINNHIKWSEAGKSYPLVWTTTRSKFKDAICFFTSEVKMPSESIKHQHCPPF
jgi:hypothetical protein